MTKPPWHGGAGSAHVSERWAYGNYLSELRAQLGGSQGGQLKKADSKPIAIGGQPPR